MDFKLVSAWKTFKFSFLLIFSPLHKRYIISLLAFLFEYLILTVGISLAFMDSSLCYCGKKNVFGRLINDLVQWTIFEIDDVILIINVWVF